MRVFVFWNLHKKMFSLRADAGPLKGKVIAHATEILLSDVVCHVNEGGRQRTIARRCKEVHAGLKASLLAFQGAATENGLTIGLAPSWIDCDRTRSSEARRAGRWLCYDPYKGPTFVNENLQGDRTPIAACNYVYGIEIDRKARLFSLLYLGHSKVSLERASEERVTYNGCYPEWFRVESGECSGLRLNFSGDSHLANTHLPLLGASYRTVTMAILIFSIIILFLIGFYLAGKIPMPIDRPWTCGRCGDSVEYHENYCLCGASILDKVENPQPSEQA